MLKTVAVPRMSLRDGGREYFERGPTEPVVLTHAADEWPATRDWSFDYFATEFGEHLGLIAQNFDDAEIGKAVKLKDFIANLDNEIDDIPGFWLGPDKMPVPAPDIDRRSMWSFMIRLHAEGPRLFDAIRPYPEAIPNLVAQLPLDMIRFLQLIIGFEFYKVFISRAGTVTPLHFDFHHSVGSLTQFAGTKHFYLVAPTDHSAVEGHYFNPEKPDFDAYPEMRGRTVHHAALQPGEMLITPPDWWHYARSEDHTITLAHNFFNHVNLADFIHSVFAGIGRMDGELLKRKIEKYLPERPPR